MKNQKLSDGNFLFGSERGKLFVVLLKQPAALWCWFSLDVVFYFYFSYYFHWVCAKVSLVIPMHQILFWGSVIRGIDWWGSLFWSTVFVILFNFSVIVLGMGCLIGWGGVFWSSFVKQRRLVIAMHQIDSKFCDYDA